MFLFIAVVILVSFALVITLIALVSPTSPPRMPQLDRTGRDVFGVVHAERVTR